MFSEVYRMTMTIFDLKCYFTLNKYRTSCDLKTAADHFAILIKFPLIVQPYHVYRDVINQGFLIPGKRYMPNIIKNRRKVRNQDTNTHVNTLN